MKQIQLDNISIQSEYVPTEREEENGGTYDGNKNHNSGKFRNGTYGCMNSAVIDYGDYTVAVWDHCFKGSVAEVYELVETPEETGLGRCECRIQGLKEKKDLRMQGMQWHGHSPR